MRCSTSRRDWLRYVLCSAGSLCLGGCGTILYPERIGQPPGPFDWKVVALDTLGLLLFIVPGAIAFAVDFSNHTIYLPPQEYYYGDATKRSAHGSLVSVPLPRDQMSQDGLEQVVSKHSGRRVSLAPGQFESRSLAKLDDFWPTYESVAATVQRAS